MSDVDALFDDQLAPLPDSDEPDTLPPAPAKIMGLPADAWALGIERKIDAVATAQHEALAQLGENFRVFKNEVRDGFNRIGDALKVIERHELALQDHQKQLDEQRRLLFAQGDRQNEIVERQEQLEQRVAALELAPAAAPKKKAQRPNKRAGRKNVR